MKKTSDTKTSPASDSLPQFDAEKLSNRYKTFVDDMKDPKFAKDMEQSWRPQVGKEQRHPDYYNFLLSQAAPTLAEKIKTESKHLIEQLREGYENNQITSEDINAATALLQEANTTSNELIEDLRNEVGLNKTNKL